jgi:Asp-tRNA(Asn)/Glu-tRNA(Gln) amidotransferase A subunit family amidase
MPTLTALSACQMARMVRSGEISAVELVQAHFARIDELNPRINAFVHLRREEALAEAEAADQAALSGEDKPLLGVPVSMKSCIDVAGLCCDAGSKLTKDYVARTDAPLVARLRNAGAIVLGNTNVPESLMAYETDNALHGRTSNPWNLDFTAGGSSGGESAAIASGLSVAGVGSDGGGSIRVPAHFTGVCALKPTPGRIPATGHNPMCAGAFSWLGVVGPMARTIGDLRLMLEVMAGADPGDPFATEYPMPRVDAEQLAAIRVAVFDTAGEARCTAETSRVVQLAASALRDAGLQTEPYVPAGLDEIWQLWEALFVNAIGMLIREGVKGRESELSEMLREYLRVAETRPPLTAESLMQTLVNRDIARGNFLRQMEQYPILLCPVSSGPAFRHREGGWRQEDPACYLRTMRYSQWFNLLGCPAAVVPVSLSPEGLPIGVQVVGRPYQEQLVLTVAEIIETRCGRMTLPALTQ